MVIRAKCTSLAGMRYAVMKLSQPLFERLSANLVRIQCVCGEEARAVPDVMNGYEEGERKRTRAICIIRGELPSLDELTPECSASRFSFFSTDVIRKN